MVPKHRLGKFIGYLNKVDYNTKECCKFEKTGIKVLNYSSVCTSIFTPWAHLSASKPLRQ